MSMRTTLDEQTRKAVADQLQPLLADIIDLGLLAKQVHWTVVGENFRSVHLQLDEIVDTAREHSDVIAERMATLGIEPDGRAGTVASGTSLESLDVSWLNDAQAVAATASRVQQAGTRARDAIKALEDLDLVSQDLVIALVTDLEKHLWMLSVQEG